MNTSVEARMEELRNELSNLFESFKENIKNIVADLPEWEVSGVSYGASSAVTFIDLTFAGDEHKKMQLRYAKGFVRWQKEEFATNIAAMGSFDMLDASGNANYYIAVGSFLSKKEMLSQLREKMIDFTGRAYELREEYNKLDTED